MFQQATDEAQPQSSADRAYELIKLDILRGVLTPGQQFAQSQLADKYRLGLTPVREALKQLGKEGFVKPYPRFGYIITHIHMDGVIEIYEMRTITEPAAVRLAAARGPERKLRWLLETANFTYSYKDLDSYSAFLSQNFAFHRAIAEASGNSRLVETISRNLDQLTRVFHLSLDVTNAAEEMRSERLALAQALYAREGERAAQLCLEEIERSRQLVLKALAEHPSIYEMRKQPLNSAPVGSETVPENDAFGQGPAQNPSVPAAALAGVPLGTKTG